jgi:hypothetical protein
MERDHRQQNDLHRFAVAATVGMEFSGEKGIA